MKVEGYELKPCGDCVNSHEPGTLQIVELVAHSEDNLTLGAGDFTIECTLCGASIMPQRTKEAAVHEWNRVHNLLLG